MFEILNFQYASYAFAERKVISKHESIRAAIKKADYLSKHGPDVLIPLNGPFDKGAIVFSRKSAERLEAEAMSYGFHLLDIKLYLDDSYICPETGEKVQPTEKRVLIERSYEFNPETGKYGAICEQSVHRSDDEIAFALDTIQADHLRANARLVVT